MSGQPLLHFWMFVGGVIVDDEVQIFLLRGNLIDHAQELQPLLMAVPVVAHADDRPVGDVKGGEQSRGPVPFVVVGHGLATTLLQR